MTRGVRMIGGKEFLLSGRFDFRPDADEEADALRHEWMYVQVLKVRHRLGSYSCWVHGAKARGDGSTQAEG